MRSVERVVNDATLKITLPAEEVNKGFKKAISKIANSVNIPGFRKPEGDYKIEDTIAILTDEEGNDIPVTMIQRWPVKRAMTNYKEKPRPFKLLDPWS